MRNLETKSLNTQGIDLSSIVIIDLRYTAVASNHNLSELFITDGDMIELNFNHKKPSLSQSFCHADLR